MKKREVVAIFMLIIIMIIALILAFPTTVVKSRYVGSHSIYLKPDCTACHTDVVNELKNSSGAFPHSNVGNITQCYSCHAGNSTMRGHNETLVECIDCHNTTAATRFDNSEVWGWKSYTTGWQELNNSVHKTMVKNNESFACMGCHTDVDVNFTWIRG